MNVPADVQEMPQRQRFMHTIMNHPKCLQLVDKVKLMTFNYIHGLAKKKRQSKKVQRQKQQPKAAAKKRITTNKKSAPKRVKRACEDDE